jgi:hypothetical protein
MTTYYVRQSGNDANNGTAPGTAWRTIDRAISASGTMSGDTLYIGSGVYREKLTARGTYVTGTYVIGDVAGAYTGDEPGEVRVTNYLTNDTTLPTDDYILVMNLKSHLTFANITFQKVILIDNAATRIGVYIQEGSTNITFRDCFFFLNDISGGTASRMIDLQCAANVSSSILIERCIFYTSGCDTSIRVRLGRSASADYNAGVTICNNLFIGDALAGVDITSSGAAVSFYGGGVAFLNNSMFYAQAGFGVASVNISTSIPCVAYNNMILHSGINGASLFAAAVGQLVEDYNLIYSSWTHDGVTEGANSIYDSSYAPLFHTGQESQWGANIRPFGMPTEDSPWLGFGNQTGTLAVDILNRPRPYDLSGFRSMNSVGAFERHDRGTESTGTYHTSPASLLISVPSDHDFELPIITGSNSITLYAMYDANSSDRPPQAQLLANQNIGVSSETITAPTGTPDNWQQLVFSPVAPTNYGVLTLRLMNRTPTGTGQVWFDTILVNDE